MVLGNVVFLIACDPRYRGPLHHHIAGIPVEVDHVVNGPIVVLFEYSCMDDVLSGKMLICDTCDCVFAVLQENDDVVNVGTIAYVLILSETCADESVCGIHVKFFIGNHHLACLNVGKVSKFRSAVHSLAILLFNMAEIVNSVVHQISQIGLDLLHLLLQGLDVLIGPLGIVFGDPFNFYLGELDDIFPCYLPVE